MNIKRIRILPLVLTFILTTTWSGNSEVIFEDDFSQSDASWKFAGGKNKVSMVVDSGTLNITESGDASDNLYVFRLFQPITLQTGQGIRFTGQIRYAQAPEAGIGHGANKNAIGIWAKDHTGIYKGARAYHVQFNPGAEPSSGKTIDFRQDIDSVAFQFDTDDRVIQPAPDQLTPDVGTQPFTFTYEIIRNSDDLTEFRFTLEQNGQTFGPYRGEDDNAGQFLSEFSRIGMRIGLPGSDAKVTLDDLKLETFDSKAEDTTSYN